MRRFPLIALLFVSPAAFADRGKIVPHIIDKIRQDRGDYDRDAPQVPLHIDNRLPPPGWQPEDLERKDRDRVPELDRSERPDDEVKRGVRTFSIGGDEEEPAAKKTPERSATGTKDKPNFEAIEAADKAIKTGDATDLDRIFGENRFAAVDALAFVASGMDQSLRHVDNATALAEARMVAVPSKPDPKIPNARLFYPKLQHALLTRSDSTPATVRAAVQSLIDIRAKAINDPPELARKLLAEAFGLMPVVSIERALMGWANIPAETAKIIIAALERTEHPKEEIARLRAFVEGSI